MTWLKNLSTGKKVALGVGFRSSAGVLTGLAGAGILLLFTLALTWIAVLAGLSASGVALGILHLVGLLLTVAIGSNYALFFDHLRRTGMADEDTLASLLLANLTTVVSFGLLATSSIPVLRAVGEVVAPGTLLAFSLAAAFDRDRDRDRDRAAPRRHGRIAPP